MNAPLPYLSRHGRTFALATILLVLPVLSYAQTPLVQWTFDSSSGVNTGSTSGTGDLTTTGSAVFTATGVGGNALNISNAYTGGTGSGNSATSATVNIGTLSTFTVTMWVNLAAGSYSNFGRILEIGTSTNPDNVNPSIYLSMNAGNLQYGVNGNTSIQAVSLLNSSAANTWVFIAFSYDGTSSTPYNSTANNTAYGTFNNGVIISGNTTTVAAVATSSGLNTGSSGSFNVSPGSVVLSGTNNNTIYLGNQSAGARGLTGLIDDVRIYGSELTLAQIQAIQAPYVSAVPEPSTYAAIFGGVALAGVVIGRRRRNA